MTREEEIDNAKTVFYERVLKDDYYYDPRDCFEEGAKWADEHPKSPWISIKDDLPCNHEEKIHKDCLSTTNVFALYSDYSLGLNYMRKINNKWIRHNGEPLYWMDMPNYLPTIENEV